MKNKYDLFNDMSINDDYEIHKLSQDEKNKLFDNLVKDINKDKKDNKNTYRKVVIASLLCLSISTALLSNDNVLALVQNIGKQIESFLGKKEDEYNGYKVEVNQSCEDKRIKVSLLEVLLDDENLLLSMNIDTSNFDESKLKKGLFLTNNYYLPEATVYIDGKKFVETGGATRYERKENNSQNFLTSLSLENIDTNNDGRSDINNYHILDNLDPNKDYDVKVVFDEVGVQKYGLIPRVINDQFEFIKGNWEFNFTVNGKKIMGETKVFDINKEISIDDEDFKALINIEQLRVSPISVKLSYTSKIGEGYSFENRDIKIELLDQNGESINVGGSGRYNEDETYMENIFEGNLEDNQKLKSIKILPYQYYMEKNSDNPK